MSDLVERLKNELGWGIGPALLCQEAAQRIEAQAKEIAELRAALRLARPYVSVHGTVSADAVNQKIGKVLAAS